MAFMAPRARNRGHFSAPFLLIREADFLWVSALARSPWRQGFSKNAFTRYLFCLGLFT
jgi:hypothetical protein